MTIREKLEEVKNSKNTSGMYIFVHNVSGYGTGMFLDELRAGVDLWPDDVLNLEVVEYKELHSGPDKRIFLQY